MLSLSLTSHLLALQTEVSNTDVQLRISPVPSSPLQSSPALAVSRMV